MVRSSSEREGHSQRTCSSSVSVSSRSTVVAVQRFGGLFGSVFVDLLRAGRLRTVPDDDLDPRVRDGLPAA